jgi:ATP-dependent 26S proteasome regulatory subunit
LFPIIVVLLNFCDFVIQIYLGESERAIRELFTLARQKEPSIRFIDGIGQWFANAVGRRDLGGRRIDLFE